MIRSPWQPPGPRRPPMAPKWRAQQGRRRGTGGAPANITGYHAHVYFDADTAEAAKALCERARDELGVKMGRMHRRPVGPHPNWSCQLAFPPDLFSTVVPWLALNRGGFVVFLHPETGDDVKDHTKHAIWMGGMAEIDVSVLT